MTCSSWVGQAWGVKASGELVAHLVSFRLATIHPHYELVQRMGLYSDLRDLREEPIWMLLAADKGAAVASCLHAVHGWSRA